MALEQSQKLLAAEEGSVPGSGWPVVQPVEDHSALVLKPEIRGGEFDGVPRQFGRFLKFIMENPTNDGL